MPTTGIVPRAPPPRAARGPPLQPGSPRCNHRIESPSRLQPAPRIHRWPGVRYLTSSARMLSARSRIARPIPAVRNDLEPVECRPPADHWAQSMNRPLDLPLISIDLAREADFSIGALRVQPSHRQVSANGHQETIQPRVMQVLVALAHAKGAVLSRDRLVETCWDGLTVGDDAINR